MTEGGELFKQQVIEHICEHAFRKECEKLKLIELRCKGVEKVTFDCCKICGSVVGGRQDLVHCGCFKHLGCNWCLEQPNKCNTCGKTCCEKCYQKCDASNCKYETCRSCKKSCVCGFEYCRYDDSNCSECGIHGLCPSCENHWCRIVQKYVVKEPEKNESFSEKNESFSEDEDEIFLSPIL